VALDVVNRFMALRDTAGSAYIAPSRLKTVRRAACNMPQPVSTAAHRLQPVRST
jgi:hypothetical protein